MTDLVDAARVEPGWYIFQRSGTYLVDEVAVKDGRAYIGTGHGVLVLPATAPDVEHHGWWSLDLPNGLQDNWIKRNGSDYESVDGPVEGAVRAVRIW